MSYAQLDMGSCACGGVDRWLYRAIETGTVSCGSCVCAAERKARIKLYAEADAVEAKAKPWVNPRSIAKHCIRGHLWSIYAAYSKHGHRRCLRCARERRATMKRTRATETHCVAGHPWTVESTGRYSHGGKQCRICHRERTRETRALQKKQGKAA